MLPFVIVASPQTISCLPPLTATAKKRSSLVSKNYYPLLSVIPKKSTLTSKNQQ